MLNQNIKNKIKKFEKTDKVAFVLIILFFIFSLITATILYYNFHTIYEIGHHEQAIWQTIHGRFFYRSFDRNNLFSLHNQPMLFILLPIYYLVPKTIIIILIQNLGICVSALFIYKFAKEKAGKKAGLVFLFLYLLFPAFYYSNIRSFSPIGLVFPFIAGSIFFMHKKRWKHFYIFFALTLICKENTSLLLIPLSIYIFFRYSKKAGLIAGCMGIFWLILSFKILFPIMNFGEEYLFINNLYSHLGESPIEISKTLIKNPLLPFTYGNVAQKITYFKVLFGYTLLLSLINIEFLIITTPIFLQNLLSNSPYKFNFVSHYNFILIPIIFYASIAGFCRLRRLIKYRTKIFLIFLLINSLIFNIVYGILPLAKENCYLFDTVYKEGRCPLTTDIIGNSKKENYPYIREFLGIIPKKASIMTQNHVFAHVSNRNKTYLFDYSYNCNYAEYILLDKSGPMTINFKNYINESTRKLGYEIIKQKKDVFLFKKTSIKEKCV